MEILKCSDDLKETLGSIIIVALAELLICLCLEGLVLIVISIVLLIVLLISCINEYVYFGRSIVLDDEGCTFQLGKLKKHYNWNDVSALYCENNHYFFGDFEMPLPGVILSGKPMKKPNRIAAMTYCRWKYPFSSVFLRFERNISTPLTAKRVYKGYAVREQELRELLKNKRNTGNSPLF